MTAVDVTLYDRLLLDLDPGDRALIEQAVEMVLAGLGKRKRNASIGRYGALEVLYQVGRLYGNGRVAK